VHLFGADAPGLPGVTFDNPFNNTTIKLGSGRTVCFTTVLAGAGVTPANNIGVFVGSSLADVRLLARVGTQAPGLAAGINFLSIPGEGVVVFGTNRVALRAFISGPGVAPGVNDKGLWVTDDHGKLQLLARIGDSIATDIGAQTMAGDFVLHDGTGQDGLASSGNRSDQLGILNNGFVNATYAYLVSFGTPVATAPKLAFVRGQDPSTLTLTWPDGYKLQSNSVLAVTGWVGIPSPSPFVLKGTAPQAFFRLMQ